MPTQNSIDKASENLMLLADQIIAKDREDEPTDYIDDITELAQFFTNRIKHRWDVVVAVCGAEGAGKSTFSKYLGAVTARLQGLDFHLQDNVLYAPTSEDLTERLLHDLPRGAPIDVDEAVKILYKLKWWDPMQIYLNMIYKICRKEGKSSMFCMPKFGDFNRGFRNDRIFIWVEVLDRGQAVILGKENAPFVEDPWHYKENQKSWYSSTRGKKVLDITTREKLVHLRKCRNYMGELYFPPLPPKILSVYEELAAEHKYDFQADAGTPTLKRYKTLISNLLKFLYEDKNMTCKEMQERFNVDQKTAARMIRKAGGEIKLGPPHRTSNQ